MELLRRHFWVVNLSIAMLCGGLAGRAGQRYFAATLLGPVAVPAHAARAPIHRALSSSPAAKDDAAIVARNLFCSHCDSARGDGGGVFASPPSSAPRLSTLPIELVATMVVPDDVAWSMAVLRETGDPRAQAALFARGSTLEHVGASVERVVNRRVYLRVGDGPLEYLDLDERVAVSATTPTRRSTASDVDCASGRCVVPRALVDQLLANPTRLGAVRFAPADKGGVRVSGLHPDNVLAQLGLRNGDTITSLNGTPLGDVTQVLALYPKLRSASQLALGVERHGARLTLDVVIR